MKRILIVEDEKDLLRLLKYNLEREGFEVIIATDGEKGLDLFHDNKPNFVLLDIMLPKIDGYEFLKKIRQTSNTPIIMITAKQEEVDKILGLELGADDYVTKPFSVREVIARIKTILRRSSNSSQKSSKVTYGRFEIDPERYEVRVSGKLVQFSPKEYEFLKALVQAEGKVLSRDKLLEALWGYDKSMEIDTRTIDQHISRLREKLGSESNRIVTVKNVGYRIKID